MCLRKKCKKIICLICLFCVVVCSANISAYADTSEGLSEENVISEVEEIVEEISEDNLSIENDMADDTVLYVCSVMDAVTDIDKDEDNCITMDVELGEIDGEVTVVAANEENTILEVNENGRKNTVSMDDSGNIFINGALAGNTYEESGDITLDAKRYYNTTKCPYGKSGDYTKTVTSGKKMGYINLTSGAVALGSIAVGIVLGIWNPPLFATIAGTIVVGVISYWAGEKLNPKYISVKKWEYYHKKGHCVKAGKWVTKRNIKLYPSKNYTGDAKYTKVSYRVIES